MSHFYAKLNDGAVEARHFVPMSSRPNELRPTRITDVRRWWREGQMVAPSVTTVINVLDKGALTNWLIEQHLHAAFYRRHFTPKEETAEEWIRRVKQAAEMEMEKAPSAGTDMHKVLEDFVQSGFKYPDDPLLAEICSRVANSIDTRCSVVVDGGAFADDWKCEQYFVSPLGYGGCADLTNAGGWVIDYKTKQTADKFKPGRMAYDDHRMQLAAYREGFGMPNARAANIFICLETGEIDFHEHKPDELAKGWAMFQHALAIWQLRNDYPADLMVAA